MAKWETRYPIEYSANGDDVDKFAQKTKAEFELIYVLLNALRQNFPLKSEPKDTLPFQWYINVSNGKIYIRNSKDDGWNVVGNIDQDYFGITAENIGAVANDGTVGKFSSGDVKDMPKTADTNDIYFALDEHRLYYFTGTSWRVFLSLNFADIVDYESYCILRDEVGYNGKDKILRLDAQTGKGNIDISGSADKIAGYNVEISNLRGGQVLAFDNATSKWKNQPKDALTSTDVSSTGAANKIVQADAYGFAHVSITGSASIVGGVKVDTSNLADKKVMAYSAANKDFEVADTISADITGSAKKFNGISIDASNLVDGQFLKYKASTKTLISDTAEYLNEDDVSESGAIGKIVRVDDAGLIHANLAGSASLIGGVAVDAVGIKDNYVLAYNAASKSFNPVKKDYVSEENISERGEVGKLIRLGADKTIHASVEKIDGVKFDLEGITDNYLLGYNANKAAVIPVTKDAVSINGINIDTANLQNGQVLMYDAKNKKFIPVEKDYLTEDDIDETGAAGKIIRVGSEPLNININGSANQLDGINVVAGKPADGDTLVYQASTNSFRTEPKGATGEGKYLTFTKGDETIGTYNGSSSETVDLSDANKLTTARTIRLTGYAQGECQFDGSADVELNVQNVTATLADSADYADEAAKLSTARKITFSGDAQGEFEFNGTKDINVALSIPTVTSATNAENATYALQAQAATAAAKAILADSASSAGTADKLSTARKISFTGAAIGEGTFDGNEDITINLIVPEESSMIGEISTAEIDAMF